MSENSRGLKYTKKQYLSVIRLYYGCSLSEAEKFYLTSTNETLESLYEGYLQESKRSFYED